MVSAIILAGGKGVRMGAGFNKIFMQLGGREIISRTIGAFENSDCIDQIVIVSSKDDTERMQKIVRRDGFLKVTDIVEGGALRQDSSYNGLLHAKGEISLIHDGARCLITPEEISAVTDDAKKYGAAAIGVMVKDTLKTIGDDGSVTGTIDRSKTAQIHTPQAFLTDQIISAHEKIRNDGITVTDDCSAFEYLKKTVHFTPGNYDNIKITTPEDIPIGEEILKRRNEL